jgi:hypothetical protein
MGDGRDGIDAEPLFLARLFVRDDEQKFMPRCVARWLRVTPGQANLSTELGMARRKRVQ